MSVLRSNREQLLTLLEQARAEGRSPEILMRLEWFIDFATHQSVSRTCRTFGIARTTFYRWLKRFDPSNLDSLVDQPTLPADGREQFTQQHAIGSATAPASSPEAVTPASIPAPALSGTWRWVTLGAFASGLLVNLLLLGALLAPVSFDGIRASLFAPTEQSLDVTLPKSESGVTLHITSQPNLNASVRDCQAEDGGWTCSLRLDP